MAHPAGKSDRKFTVTRVYSDSSGDSHFAEMEVPLADEGEIGFLSKHFPVKEMVLRKVKPSYDYDFHTAPQKQFIVLLDGEIEIETSPGDKRIFRAGDILLMEDTNGKGHRTRNLVQAERNSVFIICREE